MSSNVKLIYVVGVGPVIGTLQNETGDAIVMKDPVQFGTDENGDFVIRDYLEAVSNPEEPTTFMKYNIVSVSTPAEHITKTYVDTLKALEEQKPQIFVPEKKIIV